MSLEKASTSKAFKELIGDQWIPFHLRVQLWMLLFGPAPLKAKILDLLTVIKSPWHLRETFMAFIRNELLDLTQPLEAAYFFTMNKICLALQHKMEKEKRIEGYHVGLIADGNRRFGEMEG